MKRRILVTGGGGYIGTCVVELLLESGHEPVVFDRMYWGREPLRAFEDRITVVEGDVRHSGDLIYALQDVDAVVHLAGIVGEAACAQNLLAHHTTNVEATRTLLHCMTHPDARLVRDLVFVSSCSVYGNVAGIHDEVVEGSAAMPLSRYADGKLKSENIVRQFAETVPHVSPTILRLTTLFGWSHRMRFDLVANMFVHDAIRTGEIRLFGDGRQYRSLVHVRDVAHAVRAVLESPRHVRERQLFHVGEETNNVTIRELAECVRAHVPGTRILCVAEADTDRRDYRINCQKIKNMLDWRARYSVEDGVKELAEKLRGSDFDLDSPLYRNHLRAYS